jgi:hypothetical protein
MSLKKASMGDVKKFIVELKNGETVEVRGGILIGFDEKANELHLIHLNVDPKTGYSLLTQATKEVRQVLSFLK